MCPIGYKFFTAKTVTVFIINPVTVTLHLESFFRLLWTQTTKKGKVNKAHRKSPSGNKPLDLALSQVWFLLLLKI